MVSVKSGEEISVLATATLPVWVPIVAFSFTAIYSLFAMLNSSKLMEKRYRRWEDASRFEQVLISIFSFGQWRNRETMKAWAFQGALFGFIVSAGAVGLLLYLVAFGHHVRQ